ncbi:MAG TPA: DbpA RNA binding domain-containing protein, partial [Desulfurivibrionaceae bacterium]|nr:DbpA RNA binding domain-containing protein [Desulfurivibrionaceae bacterium]
REELIRRVAALELARVSEAYRDAPDLNVNVREEREAKAPWGAKAPGKMAARHPMARFVVSAGRKDGLRPEQFIGQINAANVGARIRIGRIDIKDSVSFIEADSRFSAQVMEALQGLRVKGRQVAVEEAGEQAPRPNKPYGSKPFGSKKGRKPGGAFGAGKFGGPFGAGKSKPGGRKKGGK